jgi:CRISP-associated protein Cas1
LVKGSKTQKITLDKQGSYLGMEKGCFTVKDKTGNVQRYPLFEKEIGEVVLRSGNCVSTGALASFGFWDIDVLIMTQKGRPVAMLKSLDDDSHVSTRLAQYEALKNNRGFEIAQTIVSKKVEGQNQVLIKHGLEPFNNNIPIFKTANSNLKSFRYCLTNYEGQLSEHYFKQVFSLIHYRIRPEHRRTFKAYDGINNLFNLGYEMLNWKVHKALINARLEPYLGFLHSEQFGKPSLICDLMEIYRYIIDDFIIGFCKELSKKNFITKSEIMSRGKIGKREYLNDNETKEFMLALDKLFNSMVNISRIRHGKRQEFETLINEESLLLAKFLRDERKEWVPRLPNLGSDQQSPKHLH